VGSAELRRTFGAGDALGEDGSEDGGRGLRDVKHDTTYDPVFTQHITGNGGQHRREGRV